MVFKPFYIFIISIFTSKITSSVVESPGPFNKLAGECLRDISEYSDNPFILRSINKATHTAIPSAQSMIAKAFDSNLLINLSSSPEFWHLLKFKGKLQDLLKDSARFLPETFPLLAEAITRKLLDESLILSQDNMNRYYKAIEENNLKHLIPNDSPIHPEEIESLHSLILRILSIPNEEQIIEIDKIQTSPKDLFLALLETITRVPNHQNEMYQPLKELVSKFAGKLDSSEYVGIIDALLKLKFYSNSIDPSDYFYLFSNLNNKLWIDYFSLVAIEVSRIDLILFPLRALVSEEIQNALLQSPDVLSKISKESATHIFDEIHLLEYRIRFEDVDFDLIKSEITRDDVIVSGYIHEPERFRQVLSRFSWFDFRDVSFVLSRFLQDLKLIQNLIVISEFIGNLQSFPELVLPEISFPVLKFIILNHESFAGLLSNSFKYFSIVVPPRVMAAVLRDNELYKIIKQNPGIFLKRIYFSFITSIPLFTEFDWKRLFDLSSVPFNFKIKNSIFALRNLHTPLSCTSLSYSLSFIKRNMANWILLETTTHKIKTSIEEYLLFSPLLSLWAQNDINRFNRYFGSLNHNLISN